MSTMTDRDELQSLIGCHSVPNNTLTGLNTSYSIYYYYYYYYYYEKIRRKKNLDNCKY